MIQIKTLQAKLGVVADGKIGKKTLEAFAKHFALSKEQVAHFFGQCAHESGNFTVFTENLNYSAERLLVIFPKYFDKDTAKEYERKPELIASRVYAGRMGNGNELSKDGWKYRGRGSLQTTGKNNYALFAEYVNNKEIINNPDLVAKDYAFDSALYYFSKNRIWSIAKTIDNNTIAKVTKMINGGINGLSERVKLTKYYFDLMS